MRLIPYRNAFGFGALDAMNRLLEPFAGGSCATGEGAWAPALDVAEREDAYIVQAELPGIDPKDVELTVENRVLKIRGERKAEEAEDAQHWRRVERRYGAFERSLRLPETVDFAKVSAVAKDGVLTVTVPKSEERKPRKITVKVK